MLREFYAKPSATLLIILLVTVAGIYEFLRLPIALYPQTSKPVVRVWINTEGTGSDEFFTRFGQNIETTFKSVKDVENVNGRYRNGNVRYEISFNWGVDPDTAQANIRNALSRYSGQFPDHWPEPGIGFSGTHSSVIYATLHSSAQENVDIDELADRFLIPKLRAIRGLESAWIRKPTSERIVIELLPDQLLQHRLTSMDIRRKLKEHEYDQTLGTIRIPGVESIQVSAVRQPKGLDELRGLVVGTHRGRPIRLREVANVRIDQTLEDRVYTSDSKRLTMLVGAVLPDANIQQVSSEFIETLKIEAKRAHPNLVVDVLLNPAEFIDEAISNVLWAVIAGMLIATLVVFLFLRSTASTIVICVSIPLSLIGSFILMDVLGIEINLISLGAMALAVGMVVDGAIVVLENVARYLEERKPQTALERLNVVFDATIEVKRAILASLLTTIIVFLPLPFTSPLASAILGDLAIVMVCVLAVSIVVTILFIPPLIMAFSSKGVLATTTNPAWFEYFQTLYIGLLDRALTSKKPALTFFGVTALATAAAAAVFFLYIPRSIIGEAESSLVMWRLDIQDDQMNLEDRVNIISHYEREVRARFGKKIVKTMSETRTEDRSTIWIFIKNRHDFEAIREELNSTYRDNALIHFSASNWAPTKLEIPAPPDLKIVMTADTDAERRFYLETIKKIANEMNIFYRVATTPSDRRDNFIKVNLQKEKLSLLTKSKGYALPTYNIVYDAISSALREEVLYTLQIGNTDFPVVLSFPNAFTRSLRNLGNLLLNYGDRVVPVRALANVERSSDWSEFYTEQGRPLAYIEAWIDAQYPGDQQDAETALYDALANEPALDPSKMHWEDTMTEVNENIYSLGSAFILALLLICVVITIQFGYLRQTALIMLAIPLGFIGVSFSLFVFESELSVNSMLGLILLCGTAINNSILFVDFFNHLEQHSGDVRSTLLTTARLRFRPIMLTALTTILGMLPIALGFGSGGEILQPLGVAVCGGLWVSTLLTIFAVPLGIWLFAKPSAH